MTRGLPSTRPRTKSGKVFGVDERAEHLDEATVAFLSASGSAPKTGSMAPGPRSLSLATAFWSRGSQDRLVERISVTSRSARKFVKKLIQPVRWNAVLRVPSTSGFGIRHGQIRTWTLESPNAAVHVQSGACKMPMPAISRPAASNAPNMV